MLGCLRDTRPLALGTALIWLLELHTCTALETTIPLVRALTHPHTDGAPSAYEPTPSALRALAETSQTRPWPALLPIAFGGTAWPTSHPLRGEPVVCLVTAVVGSVAPCRDLNVAPLSARAHPRAMRDRAARVCVCETSAPA